MAIRAGLKLGNFAHGSEPMAIRAGLKLVIGRGRAARQRPLDWDSNICP